MSSAPVTGSRAIGWPSARGGPPSVAELTRKGYVRLAERIDVTKSRHKPLSLLRQEGKRVLEQLLDADGTHLSKGDRERVVEDVLGGALGFCPLEELFRDDTRQEIITLAWNQVIARTGEQWLPTSTRFRDADQYREFVLRLAEVGTALAAGPEPAGAFDVRLPNGFRAVAILPPGVMGQPPLVLLARGDAIPVPGSSSAILTTPAPRSVSTSKSAVQPTPAPRVAPAPPATTVMEGMVSFNPTRPSPSTDSMSRPSAVQESGAFDPLARLRSRVTERLIARCAAVGMYDISQIPTGELRRILTVHIAEVAAAEKLRLDENEQERIALQILVAMNR